MRFDMAFPVFTLAIPKYQGHGGGCTVAHRGVTGAGGPGTGDGLATFAVC